VRTKNDKAKSNIAAISVVLLLLTYALANCYNTYRKQLPDLERAAGPLKAATVRITTGKNAHYYLEFSLTNNAQSFRINSDESQRPLTELLRDMQHQQQIQPGTAITVYYDSQAWWTDAQPIDVYQIELPYEVIYPIEEVHQRALNHAAFALIVLFITGTISLGQLLTYRASAKADV
jgi:hypothetical protein